MTLVRGARGRFPALGDPACQLAVAFGLVLALLHLGAWVRGVDAPTRWLATAILTVGAVPSYLHFARRAEELPLLPLYSLLVAISYGALPLLPTPRLHEPYASIPHYASVRSLWIALVGIAALVVAPELPIRVRARLPLAWNARRGVNAVGAIAVGGLAVAILEPALHAMVPDRFDSALRFLLVLGVAALCTLVALALRGGLPARWRVALLLGIGPAYGLHLVGLGGGGPAFFVALAVALVYFHERRRIPWGPAVAAALLLVLLVGTKEEMRASTQPTDNPLAKALVFVDASARLIVEPSRAGASLGDVARRVDESAGFAYVAWKTPDPVPHWGGETYKHLMWKLIPRALYPDKPFEDVAKTYPARYGLVSDETLSVTTVTLATMTEMYVNFGAAFVAVGMAALGILLKVLAALLAAPDRSPWSVGVGAAVGAGVLDLHANFSLVFGGLVPMLLAFALLSYAIFRAPTGGRTTA